MKLFISGFLQLLFISAALAQNTLLQSPVTGQPFSSGKIDDIALVSNGTDVVLVAANNTTNKMYAIDINDKNPADAVTNAIVSNQNTFKTNLMVALGLGSGNIINFEVNPITKSIYVLFVSGANSYIAVVKNGGTQITGFPLTNVTYAEIGFKSTTGKLIQDMTSGDNKLFFSIGGSGLDGEIGKIPYPFIHGSNSTNMNTTMFKSNWGTTYFTDAPLEKMDFHLVSGTKRLSGVTVCAPGFSLPSDNILAAGTLTVTEDFDMWNGPTKKVVAVKQGTTSYLVDLHDENFNGNYAAYRIGHKYLDGSQIGVNQYNLQSDKLRSNGNPAAGKTDAEIKKLSGYYTMIAYYNECELLALDKTDVLKLVSLELCSTVGLSNSYKEEKAVSIYPNPANNHLTIKQTNFKISEVFIYSIDGKLVKTFALNVSEQVIDVSTLATGTYIVKVRTDGNIILDQKLVK